MKATGIVRRIDDLGRIVITKEIRRTLWIRMGDPSLKTLTRDMVFCMGVECAAERYIGK
ncbi:MAG: stage V sporulation protein T [Oscillospiraceae bacterium]|nr:stage V sporulation protein T [Oscillospiraceae bacterium]